MTESTAAELIAAHMITQPHASKWLVEESLAGVVPPVWAAIEVVYAPRVVSTVAELDALPVETVFMMDRGGVWEVVNPCTDGTELRYSSTQYRDRYQSKTFASELPATIIYSPPEAS